MEKYPKGKMSENDEGALAIVFFIKNERLVIDFGKDLSWVGFDRGSLRTFIDALENKYKEL